jgi:Ca2+-binding EF-hand superfamily protein
MVKLKKNNNKKENEIKDAFNFYDQEKTNTINRTQLRSILGNFAFANMNVKEIEEEIKSEYPSNTQKNQFYYDDVITLITNKWYYGGGREAEAAEIFKLFDRKYI